MPSAETERSVRTAARLSIDPVYLRSTVDALCRIGSSPLGFRNTGTTEDAAVAQYVGDQMRSIGLQDVAVEEVVVDAWRFLEASVTTADGSTVQACSWGGVPGTGPGGVSGPLVYLRDARRRFLDRVDLSGAVVLVDWRGPTFDPPATAVELQSRGAVAMVLTCPSGGAWYQSPNALGAFNGSWAAGGLPMVFVTKEDALDLRAARGESVTVRLLIETAARTAGHNVVGYLPGDLAGPVVVGAHSDAWFRGAFDNTSAVAALLAMAGALVEADHRPRHTICFTTRTAEEYGIADSRFDWCIGAWEQVHSTHPNWGAEAPFHVCLEASGHRSLRTVLEAPIELTAWARRIGRLGAAQGWAPTGWRVARPVAGTEQWPYLVSGVPGIASYQWETSFGRTDYHTQHDTIDLLDFDILAAQTRMYALLLLEADRDPDATLDHVARADQLAGVAVEHGHERLALAARAHRSASGRYAFTAVGRALFALDATSGLSLPHAQCATDLAALDEALRALTSAAPYAAPDLRAAAQALARVGGHTLHAYLSEGIFDAHRDRFEPSAITRSWASASHLTSSPRLYDELSTLRAEPTCRPFGPWLTDSLRRARVDVHRELRRRLDGMADALESIQPGELNRAGPTTGEPTRAARRA